MLFQKQSQWRPSSAARRRPTQPLQVEQLEHRWCPSYSLVTSRAALAGTDSVDWSTLGAPGTSVANPFTVSSVAGQSITVSKTLSGNFLLDEQWGPTTPNSYVIHGNFAPGDTVLDTNTGASKQNTIKLNFGATAVAAGGAQIMTNTYGSFTAEVDALDAKGKTLARFTEAGNATDAADNSAIFLGVSSTSPTIYQITISVTRAASDQYKGVFAINKFDFRTGAVAAAAPVIRTVAGADFAPLASSLLRMGQPDVPAKSFFGSPASPAPRTGSALRLPTAAASAVVPAEAADAVFATSHTATPGEATAMLTPLATSSLDTL
jgi:hypothetical protein